jgi:hypothetical protein
MGNGGGRIIENDQTISVNNPETIRAWQRAARWVGSISPHDVTAHAKWDAGNVWAAGKAAFIRGWASDYSMVGFIDLQRVLLAMVSPAYRGTGMAEQTCWEETVWQFPAFRRTPKRRVADPISSAKRCPDVAWHGAL